MALSFRPPLVAMSLCLAGLLAVAGCGSSSGKSSGSATAGTTGSSPAAPSAGGTTDPDTVAVTAAFVKLFDGTAPTDQRLAQLQGGDVLAQSIGAAINTPVLKQTSATVSKVTVASATQAQVTYTVSLSGTPVLPNITGTAVKVDGSWKVAAATFCALLSAQGAAPAACTQASVTALPS